MVRRNVHMSQVFKEVYVQACCWYRLTPEVLQSASRSNKYSIGPETQAGKTFEIKEGITYSMIYLYFLYYFKIKETSVL